MMKTFVTLAAFAAGTNALVSRADSCCFHLTASGGASGSVGQLSDGQNRIGDSALTFADYCINSSGGITDSSGRGCILTPPTTQFQCDKGASPTTGFSVASNGELEYNGSTSFIACQTGQNGGLNIYTSNSTAVTMCKRVTLKADSCSGSGAGAGASGAPSSAASSAPPAHSSPAGSVSAPGASAPAGSAPGASAPAGSAPAGSAPAGSAPAGSAPAGSAPAGSAPAGSAPGASGPAGSAPAGSAPAGSAPAGSAGSAQCLTGAPVTTTVTVTDCSCATGAPAPGGSGAVGGGSAAPSSSAPAGAVGGGSSAPGASSAPGGSGAVGGGSRAPTSSAPAGAVGGGSPALSSSVPAGATGRGSQPSGSAGGSPARSSSAPAGAASGGSLPAPSSSVAPSGPAGGAVSSGQAGGAKPSGMTSVPASSASSTPSPVVSSGSHCPTTLSNGHYQYPHLIVPIDSSSPNSAPGTSYNGTVTSTISTIFNFDIPQDYSDNTCSLVFLFPKKADLETSSYNFSGDGKIDISKLSAVATQSTDYSNAPSVAQDLGYITISPGNSYVVSTFACPAGQTVAYEMKNAGSTNLNFFEDWNPSPLGLFITTC